MIPAPEFPGGHTWFNVSEPLSLSDLRGKVVLLDFWTSGCINCQHIIPDLTRLEDEFADELVIIGVHSGKYDREQEDESVRQSILRFGLRHAVVNDPDFVIWSTYGVNAWPTLVLIDPAGNVVGGRSGEGIYPVFQPVVAALVEEFDARGEIDRSPIAIDLEAAAVTSAFLSYPAAVLTDEAGDRLFIADSGHNRILIAGLDGELRGVIGSGQEGFDDGSFEDATLRQPQGLVLSADGNTLYIADTRNHAIRAADLRTSLVTTIAGTGLRALTLPQKDGPAVETDLASPWGLLLHDGTLYIAMAGTHQIWTIDIEANTISVFAGSGGEGIQDGPRHQATLAQPSGLTTDGSTLYWVDPESSSVRRLSIDGEGDVETLVGTGLFDFGDADGAGVAARLEHPQGIVYANGTLYVADTYNHKLRTVDPASGEVVVVAGGTRAGFDDGPGVESLLSEPSGLSVANGILYIADSNNQVIRLMDLRTNAVSTLELTNLAVAARGVEGRTLKVSLPGQTVSPGTSTLRIRLATPEHFYLNSLVRSELTLTSSNAPVLELGEETIGWTTDDPFVELLVSVSVNDGDAVLTAQGQVYYCRKGDEAICLIENVDIALPLTVEAGAASSQVVLDYALPGPTINN
ncbi:MAG: redoxin domain-containing protein [Chloroflexi bacterium]|nr:redoxin domain-containing protein [Chloroflexota bacterium]